MPADASRIFFDSNTLLYLLSGDIAKARKLDPYLKRGGMISVQVLNEVTNVARRKYGLEVPRIRPFLLALRNALVVVPSTVEIHELGLAVIERYGFSTYDALIIAAALHNECDLVLSEDLQDGMKVYDALTIRNPFTS